jgi:hypothetical protein
MSINALFAGPAKSSRGGALMKIGLLLPSPATVLPITAPEAKSNLRKTFRQLFPCAGEIATRTSKIADNNVLTMMLRLWWIYWQLCHKL